MKTLLHRITIGLIVLFTCTTIWGQTVQDSIKNSKGFDATQEAFQKRYRFPDAVPFDTLWKNNISFSVYGGLDRFIPRGDGDFNTGPVMGVGMNWRFAPAHTVRGVLQYGSFARKIDNEMLRRFGLQADYLLNITSFMKGYNPGRLFEISAMAGIGYQYASFLGNNEHAADLHFGVQLKLHPTSQVDFFLEPRFSFLSDGIDHSDQKNWHKYDMTYGAVVGMTYHLKDWKPFGGIRLLDGDKMLDNTFISVAGGGQFQISKLTNEIGLTKAIGPHVAVSVGKWLVPAFGLRFSAFTSADTWHKKVLDSGEMIYEMSTYNGVRLEGIMNVNQLVSKKEVQSPFSVNLLAGGEVGSIKKENGFSPAKGGYTGFTGGMQFKYRLFDDVSVFVEPRVTMASFTLRTNQKIEGRYVAERYTDNLFNLNVGIEIARANEENRLAREVYAEEFTPQLFVSAGVGLGMPLQMKRFRLKNYLDYNGMVAAGYTFTPLHAARVSADFGPYSMDLKTRAVKYNMPSVGLDYMLNLTNMMMGYDPARKYDVQWVAGVVGSMRMKPSEEIADEELNKSKFFVGLGTGIHASYQVADKFKVFIEPKLRFYSKELLMQSSIQGKDMMLLFHAGTTYTF